MKPITHYSSIYRLPPTANGTISFTKTLFQNGSQTIGTTNSIMTG